MKFWICVESRLIGRNTYLDPSVDFMDIRQNMGKITYKTLYSGGTTDSRWMIEATMDVTHFDTLEKQEAARATITTRNPGAVLHTSVNDALTCLTEITANEPNGMTPQAVGDDINFLNN